MMKGLRILARPAWSYRRFNPYIHLLYEALTALGCRVRELTRANGLYEAADISHIHWPQAEVGWTRLKALQMLVSLVVILVSQRLRGIRIVWTAHNVRSHSHKHPVIEAMLMWVVTRILHGVIYLSESSRVSCIAAFPVLARKPDRVIPHGLYEHAEGALGATADARAYFSLRSEKPIVGFVGDIKPYKGLDLLLDAMAGMRPGEITVFIAGAFQVSADYADPLRKRIAELQSAGHDIVFQEKRLDDRELENAIVACDLIVLPYRHITNSGFALLVLGLGKPAVVTEAAVFRELHDELGERFVRIAGETIGADAIRSAIAAPPDAAALAQLEAFRAVRTWPAIAEQTLDFYHSLR